MFPNSSLNFFTVKSFPIWILATLFLSKISEFLIFNLKLLQETSYLNYSRLYFGELKHYLSETNQ